MPSPHWLFALIPLLAAGLLLLARGPLLRRWPALGAVLRHGRWPWPYTLTHAFFIFGFPLLMISGVALYYPPWHATLIAWLSVIRNAHVWLGIGFGALLLGAALAVIARLQRSARRIDWLITGLLTALVTLTGFALWLPSRFPASWDAVAFGIHGVASYIWLAWLVAHALLRLFSFQRQHPLNARFDYSRRAGLKGALGLGALSAGTLSVLGGMRLRDSAAALADSAPGAATAGSPGLALAAARAPVFPAYYTFTNDYPVIDPDTFRLRVEGLVDHPLELTLAQLEALEAERAQRTFHCVTGWSVPNVLWTGVRPQTLLELAGAQAAGTHLIFHSADGTYVDQLSVEQARLPGVLLAYRIDDVPLPRQGGYPLRLVVPPMYGYKSVKWVNRIVVADHDIVGTWERYGYADDAWIGGVKPA